MKKTKESIEKNLSMVDVVFELIDARIPYSSQNPIIDSIVKDKPRIVILNKADLASDKGNKEWIEYFKENDLNTILFNSLTGKGIDELIKLSKEVTAERKKIL